MAIKLATAPISSASDESLVMFFKAREQFARIIESSLLDNFNSIISVCKGESTKKSTQSPRRDNR